MMELAFQLLPHLFTNALGGNFGNMKTKRFKLSQRKPLIQSDEVLTDEELEKRRQGWAEWKSSGQKVSTVKTKLPSINRTPRSRKIQTPTLVCSGITKKGLPCRNKTKNPNGYCHIH